MKFPVQFLAKLNFHFFDDKTIFPIKFIFISTLSIRTCYILEIFISLFETHGGKGAVFALTTSRFRTLARHEREACVRVVNPQDGD